MTLYTFKALGLKAEADISFYHLFNELQWSISLCPIYIVQYNKTTIDSACKTAIRLD